MAILVCQVQGKPCGRFAETMFTKLKSILILRIKFTFVAEKWFLKKHGNSQTMLKVSKCHLGWEMECRTKNIELWRFPPEKLHNSHPTDQYGCYRVIEVCWTTVSHAVYYGHHNSNEGVKRWIVFIEHIKARIWLWRLWQQSELCTFPINTDCKYEIITVSKLCNPLVSPPPHLTVTWLLVVVIVLLLSWKRWCWRVARCCGPTCVSSGQVKY